MKLVVGLGNPGAQYQLTRHNIGFIVLESLQQTLQLQFSSKFNSLYAKTVYKGVEVFFLQPLTYINLSGMAISKFASYYKIKSSEILIIHDEVALPFGKIQFKNGGSHAGHNGLKNIYEMLKTQNIFRLRIGIGKNDFFNTADWVLSKFTPIEMTIITNNLAFFQKAIFAWISKLNY